MFGLVHDRHSTSAQPPLDRTVEERLARKSIVSKAARAIGHDFGKLAGQNRMPLCQSVEFSAGSTKARTALVATALAAQGSSVSKLISPRIPPASEVSSK